MVTRVFTCALAGHGNVTALRSPAAAVEGHPRAAREPAGSDELLHPRLAPRSRGEALLAGNANKPQTRCSWVASDVTPSLYGSEGSLSRLGAASPGGLPGSCCAGVCCCQQPRAAEGTGPGFPGVATVLREVSV